ncbi:MAG: tRNA pseudouridine(38-40) synthase TruA [Vicingaceae bacterium]
MKRYFAYLMFDGTPFHGWQAQPNAPSVQEEVEKALKILMQAELNVVGAGRTDTGVHAEEMAFHFDCEESLDKQTFLHRMNSLLPKSIALYDLKAVKSDFHARFDASSRTYRYLICQQKNPFFLNRAYQFNQELDVNAMNRAAAELLGTHDFSCFSKAHTQTFTNNCELSHAEWRQEGHLLVFQISANRFLRNMVRAIVGTLIEVGMGKRKGKEMKALIESKNRSNAGSSVPAAGLYLHKIEYPASGFL